MDAHDPPAITVFDREMRLLASGAMVAVDDHVDNAIGTLGCRAMVHPVGDALLYPNQFVIVHVAGGNRIANPPLSVLPPPLPPLDDASAELQQELRQAQSQLARQQKAYDAGAIDGAGASGG